MADSQWYYAVAGEQLGPVSTAELRDLIRAGNVGPEDLVWCEGMSDWSESRTVKALSPPRRVAKAPSAAPAVSQGVNQSPARRARSASPSAREADAAVEAPPVEAPPQVAAPTFETPVPESPSQSPDSWDDSPDVAESDADVATVDSSEVDNRDNQYNLDDSLSDAMAGHEAADSSESDSDDEVSEPEVAPVRRKAARAAVGSSASAGRAAEPAPHALYSMFLLVLWIVTALALMAVSIVFAIQWKKATDAAEQTATATTFVVWFVAVYCIARACERVLQLLGHHKP